MKRVIFFGLVLLTAGMLVGCACYPYGYNRGCSTGVCTTGCGVVDYVDGGSGAGMADCGSGCGYSTGTCGNSGCSDCLRCIGNSIRIVGEGALAIAAAPFVLAGHVICSGCNGYGTYPNCGCSNEVYYGDNCAQRHDYVDPCVGGCDCGTSNATGCTRCSGGYTEGVQPAQAPQNAVRRPSNVRTVSHQQAPSTCPAHATSCPTNNGQIVNGAWSNQTPANMVR